MPEAVQEVEFYEVPTDFYRLMECSICRALVADASTDDHTAWHEHSDGTGAESHGKG